MDSTLKNCTFSIPLDLLQRLRELVKNNSIPSLNAGVREALEEYTDKIAKEQFRQNMIDASKDPLFLTDINETMTAFSCSDNELFESECFK